MTTKDFSIGEAFRYGWAKYNNNRAYIFFLTLWQCVPNPVFGTIGLFFSLSFYVIILFFGASIFTLTGGSMLSISGLAAIALFIALLNIFFFMEYSRHIYFILKDEKYRFEGLSFSLYFKFVKTWFLYWFMLSSTIIFVLLWFFVLEKILKLANLFSWGLYLSLGAAIVIPALYLASKGILYPFVIIDKKLNSIAALEESYYLSSRYKGKLFIITLLPFAVISVGAVMLIFSSYVLPSFFNIVPALFIPLCFIAGIITVLLGLYVINPVVWIALAFIYNWLQSNADFKTESVEVSETSKKTRLWPILIFASIWWTIVAAFILMFGWSINMSGPTNTKLSFEYLDKSISFSPLYEINYDYSLLSIIKVSLAGDVNKDGICDIIIGNSRLKTACVYSGKDGALLFKKEGQYTFGQSVSSAGDVNKDGYCDFIVGAPYDNGGIVCVFSGKDGSLIYQKNGNGQKDENFGENVAGGGDVNHDGHSDFIVAGLGTTISGKSNIYIYSGKDGSLIYKKEKEHYEQGGEKYGTHFGASIAFLGDINKDGCDDFIVGDDYANLEGGKYAGTAFVFSGATGEILYSMNGKAQMSHFGKIVSSAGDVNKDEIPDFMIATGFENYNNNQNAGSVYVYSGADGSLIWEKHGNFTYSRLGCVISPLGDINRDSADDLIIGSTDDKNPTKWIRFLEIYSGLDGILLCRINSSAEIENQMEALGNVDLNDDGKPDLIIAEMGTIHAYASSSNKK